MLPEVPDSAPPDTAYGAGLTVARRIFRNWAGRWVLSELMEVSRASLSIAWPPAGVSRMGSLPMGWSGGQRMGILPMRMGPTTTGSVQGLPSTVMHGSSG